jgi:FkbM family methyltransferase
VTYKYLVKDRITFYWRYFGLKVFYLWFEVKRPKLRMFTYEMIYSANKLVDPKSLFPSPFNTDFVETVFGKFRIRPGTVDMSNVSPAYERGDLDYTLKIIGEKHREGKRILFLDIGADLGTFSVAAGRRFKHTGDLNIVAFEPEESSFALLRENLLLNKIESLCETHNFALYSEDKQVMFYSNAKAPGSSGIKTSCIGQGQAHRKVQARTLDSVIGERAKDYDIIFFKIDVEGVEVDVLKGAEQVLNSGKEIFMVVEDFVNPEIIVFMDKLGAEFIRKITPYNSWWKYTAKS